MKERWLLLFCLIVFVLWLLATTGYLMLSLKDARDFKLHWMQFAVAKRLLLMAPYILLLVGTPLFVTLYPQYPFEMRFVGLVLLIWMSYAVGRLSVNLLGSSPQALLPSSFLHKIIVFAPIIFVMFWAALSLFASIVALGVVLFQSVQNRIVQDGD